MQNAEGGRAGEGQETDQAKGRPSPEIMRKAVADYVAAAHAAYVRQARVLPPAVQGRLSLFRAGRLWVAAAGARYLHIVGTTEALGGATGREVQVEGEVPPLRWTLGFYDPVVLPGLALVREEDGPAFEEVRGLLGIRTYLYHLTVKPPAELGEHHAGHTGAGLANAHAAEAREFDAIRTAAGDRAPLVDEMEGAGIAGLMRAQALLAQAIAPGDSEVEALAGQERPDPAELRRAVLAAVRRGS